MSNINLDNYYMQLAKLTALRSNDPNTKVGACIVKNNKVLTLGHNSVPQLFPDNLVPIDSKSSKIKEQKNTYMIHAELNAIFNYTGNIIDFNGATIYITHSPCYDCVKALIQLGIKKIVYEIEYHNKEVWDAAKYILMKCRIEFEQLKGELNE